MRSKIKACILFIVLANQSYACPFCTSDTAKEIRASLFDERFFSNLIIALLPFAISLLIVWLIFKIGWHGSDKIKKYEQ